MNAAPIQAFVLRCPECGAPQPGPEPTCKYCKVPLMWAPTVSLSRDDGHAGEIEDEPGTVLNSFGPHAVAGGARQVFQHLAQRPMRPTFLWIVPAYAPNFGIESVRIGPNELIDCTPCGTSALPFARGRGWPITHEFLNPGVLFQITVTNRTVFACNFEAILRCKILPRNSGPPSPYVVPPLGMRPGLYSGHKIQAHSMYGEIRNPKRR